MARGITEKDVFSACDALVLAGERPTIERVRQKIGRGSPNTVSPMLDAWFKGLGRRLQDPGAFAPAPEVPDPVLQAAQHFWEVAQAESRRDFESQISAGLANAQAQVDEARRHAGIAEATAAEAAARAVAIQAELERLRESLDSERLNHRGTTTQLDGVLQRSTALEAEAVQLRQAVVEERARADRAIAVADERSSGAERRAAMEIEGERTARTRAEKQAESIAKKFESALRDQVRATEQANAAQDRLVVLRSQADQREQELQDELKRHEERFKNLETKLAQTIHARERAVAQAEAVQATVQRLESVIVSAKPARIAPKRSSKA